MAKIKINQEFSKVKVIKNARATDQIKNDTTIQLNKLVHHKLEKTNKTIILKGIAITKTFHAKKELRLSLMIVK